MAEISDEELAELARLHKAADDGVWRTLRDGAYADIRSKRSDGSDHPVASEIGRRNAASIVANHNAIGRLITELQARRAAEEKAAEALALAETIIRQLPQNGKNWDTVSRFWAAVSALPRSTRSPR